MLCRIREMEKRPSNTSTASEDDQRQAKKHKTATIKDIRDPVSLQELWRVNASGEHEPAEGVLCYEEKWDDGKVFVRGFELETIANMLSRVDTDVLRHPVSGRLIPAVAVEKAKLLIKEKGITAEIEDFGSLSVSELTSEKMRFFALEVFQLLAAIDVRMDENRFMELSKEKLAKLAMELKEMMDANLPEFVMDVLKHEANGRRPFVVVSRSGTEGDNWWRQFLLKEIRRVFLRVKTLGKEVGGGQLQMLAYIVLGAMATVCPEIRQSFRDNLVFSFDFNFDDDESDVEEDDSSCSETL
jgi:hypothetical protein